MPRSFGRARGTTRSVIKAPPLGDRDARRSRGGRTGSAAGRRVRDAVHGARTRPRAIPRAAVAAARLDAGPAPTGRSRRRATCHRSWSATRPSSAATEAVRSFRRIERRCLDARPAADHLPRRNEDGRRHRDRSRLACFDLESLDCAGRSSSPPAHCASPWRRGLCRAKRGVRDRRARLEPPGRPCIARRLDEPVRAFRSRTRRSLSDGLGCDRLRRLFSSAAGPWPQGYARWRPRAAVFTSSASEPALLRLRRDDGSRVWTRRIAPQTLPFLAAFPDGVALAVESVVVGYSAESCVRWVHSASSPVLAGPVECGAASLVSPTAVAPCASSPPDPVAMSPRTRQLRYDRSRSRRRRPRSRPFASKAPRGGRRTSLSRSRVSRSCSDRATPAGGAGSRIREARGTRLPRERRRVRLPAACRRACAIAARARPAPRPPERDARRAAQAGLRCS